jgi:preprotein translocase subunit SecF
VVASIVGVVYPGPNYGTDFVGGTEIHVRFRGAVRPDELRSELERLGYERADVVSVVDRRNTYIIRVRDFSAIDRTERRRVRQAVTRFLPENVRLERLRVPRGGDSVQLDLSGEINADAMRAALEAARISVLRVVRIGQAQDHTYEVQLEGVAEEMMEGLAEHLGDRGPDEPERIDRVGPRAGAQLRDAAIKSLLYAIAFIMVYVAFRFDLRFAPGGVLALAHDALVTLGVYVVLQKEITLGTIAAVLTVVGFSINDTIVVYDRIRENMQRLRDASLAQLINISTSQTLGRTVITSGVALVSISGFFIWGTPLIRDITFALTVGFIAGSYSSIYVAAPLTEWMDRRFFRKV